MNDDTPLTDALLIALGAAGSTSRFAEHARELERKVNRLKTEQQIESEWKSIETAPKDGTEIIMWGPHPNFGPPIQTHWHEKYEGEGSWLLAYEATHWMPIPWPPKI